eukprot:TRINITY_DN4349_c0_g1_i2.p1 TRINITY_DN4349_c0_g1~~TRINITY_DN4349_c0_g1_i2.p1  ORF type:complete len:770 (+),score=176.22 TRINITY_DN4349_c0_g1_i2:161-2470(+)
MPTVVSPPLATAAPQGEWQPQRKRKASGVAPGYSGGVPGGEKGPRKSKRLRSEAQKCLRDRVLPLAHAKGFMINFCVPKACEEEHTKMDHPPCERQRTALGWPKDIPFVHPDDLFVTDKQRFIETFDPGWSQREGVPFEGYEPVPGTTVIPKPPGSVESHERRPERALSKSTGPLPMREVDAAEAPHEGQVAGGATASAAAGVAAATAEVAAAEAAVAAAPAAEGEMSAQQTQQEQQQQMQQLMQQQMPQPVLLTPQQLQGVPVYPDLDALFTLKAIYDFLRENGHGVPTGKPQVMGNRVDLPLLGRRVAEAGGRQQFEAISGFDRFIKEQLVLENPTFRDQERAVDRLRKLYDQVLGDYVERILRTYPVMTIPRAAPLLFSDYPMAALSAPLPAHPLSFDRAPSSTAPLLLRPYEAQQAFFSTVQPQQSPLLAQTGVPPAPRWQHTPPSLTGLSALASPLPLPFPLPPMGGTAMQPLGGTAMQPSSGTAMQPLGGTALPPSGRIAPAPYPPGGGLPGTAGRQDEPHQQQGQQQQWSYPEGERPAVTFTEEQQQLVQQQQQQFQLQHTPLGTAPPEPSVSLSNVSHSTLHAEAGTQQEGSENVHLQYAGGQAPPLATSSMEIPIASGDLSLEGQQHLHQRQQQEQTDPQFPSFSPNSLPPPTDAALPSDSLHPASSHPPEVDASTSPMTSTEPTLPPSSPKKAPELSTMLMSMQWGAISNYTPPAPVASASPLAPETLSSITATSSAHAPTPSGDEVEVPGEAMESDAL